MSEKQEQQNTERSRMLGTMEMLQARADGVRTDYGVDAGAGTV